MNSNLIRSFFWGTICFIMFSVGIVGFIFNNRIINTYKNDVDNIITIFNNNETIQNYITRNININVDKKGKNIIVTVESVNIEKYKFELKQGYLETSYVKNDSFGKIITMIMADSVAVYKGLPKESVYPLFNNNEIYKYDFEEGISFETKKDKYLVKINLSSPIINIVNNTSD